MTDYRKSGWQLHTGGISRRAVLAGSASGVAAAALGFRPAAAQSSEPVKLGFVFPFTGRLASYGESAGPGVDLAMKMINERGGIQSLGGAPIEVFRGDDQGDAKLASSEIERLVTREEISGLIGVFSSTEAVSIGTLADQYEIPFLSPSWTTAKAFTIGSTYSRTFNLTGETFAKGGVSMLKYLNEERSMNAKKVGLIYDGSEYGRGVADIIKENLKGTEYTVVEDLPYTAPITDFVPQVLRLRNSGAEVLMAAQYYQETVLLLRAMDSLDYRVPFVGCASGFSDFRLPGSLGSATAERILSGPVFGPVAVSDLVPYQPLQAFLDRARAEGHNFGSDGLDVNWFVLGAQALFIYKAALEAAGSRDGKDINDALLSAEISRGSDELIVPFYDPALSWEETGRPRNQVVPYIQWQDTEMKVVYPPDIAAADVKL
jgi:ABC-type branched-chain amino acid transport systems, periplasmic component